MDENALYKQSWEKGTQLTSEILTQDSGSDSNSLDDIQEKGNKH